MKEVCRKERRERVQGMLVDVRETDNLASRCYEAQSHFIDVADTRCQHTRNTMKACRCMYFWIWWTRLSLRIRSPSTQCSVGWPGASFSSSSVKLDFDKRVRLNLRVRVRPRPSHLPARPSEGQRGQPRSRSRHQRWAKTGHSLIRPTAPP